MSASYKEKLKHPKWQRRRLEIMNYDIQYEGLTKLQEAVNKDQTESPGFHDYQGKLNWVIERAKHYAEKTGIPVEKIIDAWESERRYWYMNYYQECNQPLITNEHVKIFDTAEELRKSIGIAGFRCPYCKGVSTDPYDCDSGKEIAKDKICDWKVYGLLGDLGQGVFVFVKDKIKGERIFMPISWEQH